MRTLSSPSSLKRAMLFCVAAAAWPGMAGAQALPPASQVADQIIVGWNVGNSLEAIGGETAWGNPAVSQQLVNSVKAAGFNAIRIPCSWDQYANQSTLQIDPAWLARVKQVVDYAHGQGMYVILNIHWDGGWLEEHPLFSHQVAVNQKQRAFWTQIATYFRDYNERLLFAGTNEVHADFGTPTSEHITVQQSYLQTFVEAVRETGGNNATRTLVVQTYNTNIWHGLDFFTLPVDTATNRLMVEVHHYDPYDYTLNPNGSCLFWGSPYPTQGACTWAQESYHDDLFDRVNGEWIAQGIPVIIGEYGVATRPNLSLPSRQYYLEYVNRAAALNGIKTFYWDNGVSPSQTNGFALFNRTTGAVADQGALDAVLRGAGVGNPNVNYTLTTNVSGQGTVSRNPPGTTYPGGTSVTLTATAANGFDFAGWTGGASGSANPVTIRILGNTTVTANFVPEGTGGTGTILREYWLNVTGTTVSSLTSSPSYPNSPTGSEQLASLEGPTNAGENYGARIRGYVHPPITGAYTFWLASDDYGDLRLGTSDDPATATRIAFVEGWAGPREWGKYPSQRSAAITLTAGQRYYIEVLHKEAFGGDNVAVAWQGPGIAQAVIGGSFLSPFVPQQGNTFALTVGKAGTGSGTVTSAPAGVSCGSTCSANYTSGTSVTLTATPATGSTFAGWTGACTNATGTCTVSMTQARSVTATFNSTVTAFALTVARNGTGTGTVTSAPAGINCGSTCSATYTSGTSVTLTAAAAGGSTFAGWGGACTGTGGCTVSMTQARSVTATFNSTVTAFALTVARNGTGTGTVTSAPAGINCGSTCSANYTSGTSVTLTATPATGSAFAGWTGACTNATGTCTVSMTQARTVTATFNTTGGGTTCANPITFTGNTNNFNTTGPVCYRTNATINGWGCFNFDGRTVTVGGVARTCGQMPLTRSSDGYYYFAVTAGQFPWAGIFTW